MILVWIEVSDRDLRSAMLVEERETAASLISRVPPGAILSTE